MDEGVPPAGGHGGAAPRVNTPAGDAASGGAMPKALSPARYLAWLYSTDAQKPVLAALLEIEAEIASGLRPGIEHHVAHARLQWWSEEAERVTRGQPVHPLAKELVKVTSSAAATHASSATHAGEASARSIAAAAAAYATGSTGLPAAANISSLADIAGFVDTGVWDLARATFETGKELTAYCERWAAAMFETAASARNGGSSPARDLAPGAARASVGIAAPEEVARAPSPWKSLGAAAREIELLADAARDAHAGRVRLPLDELDRVGVEPNALAKLPWPAPLAALLKERHQALRATIATTVAALASEEQMRLRGLLVWVTLTWRLSVRAERALPHAILPRRYDALADGWQAWRAARRAGAGKLRFG